MNEKPIHLRETQIKRVDEHVQRLCDIQFKQLAGTEFESFTPFLKRSWEFIFNDFFSSDDGFTPTPIFQVVVENGVLKIQSALVSMQFTTSAHPRYLDKISLPIFNCVVWETGKGDGTLQPKELPSNDILGPDGLSAELMINILRDILPSMVGKDSAAYPMHLMALVLQIITYHMVSRMAYLGVEVGLTHPCLEGDVIKASFGNGLRVHTIYISESVAAKDWEDLMNRFNETYKDRDGK